MAVAPMGVSPFSFPSHLSCYKVMFLRTFGCFRAGTTPSYTLTPALESTTKNSFCLRARKHNRLAIERLDSRTDRISVSVSSSTRILRLLQITTCKNPSVSHAMYRRREMSGLFRLHSRTGNHFPLPSGRISRIAELPISMLLSVRATMTE